MAGMGSKATFGRSTSGRQAQRGPPIRSPDSKPALRKPASISGRPRAWGIDVADTARADETAFLHAEIYKSEVDILVRRIVAYDRFSDRC